MAKKIFGVIATGIVLLLALFFAVVLLFQQRDFFGKVIMWILFLCVVILFFFVVYLVVSRIKDITKENKMDESNLSERHIEKILATGSSSSVEMQLNEDEQAALEAVTRKREELFREEERLKNIKKQEEFVAIKKESADRERADWDNSLYQQQQEIKIRIERIKHAEETALERANQLPDESDRRFAMGEYDALVRARQEAEQQLVEEVEQYYLAKRQAEEEDRRQHALFELRKSQEMESVKRQADSLDQARRRAAQAAATGSMMTQRINPTSVSSPLSASQEYTRNLSQTAALQSAQGQQGFVSAGFSTHSLTAQGRSSQQTSGNIGVNTRQMPTENASRPYSIGAQTPRAVETHTQYAPRTGGSYNPAPGSGFVVPKPASSSQQFSAAALRAVTQQTAASRSLGGARPIYDTTQFSTAELGSFQEMKARTENRRQSEYVPKTLPLTKPPSNTNK